MRGSSPDTMPPHCCARPYVRAFPGRWVGGGRGVESPPPPWLGAVVVAVVVVAVVGVVVVVVVVVVGPRARGNPRDAETNAK
eukprot:3448161-Pyramimonas_sp.AAC.1